jgi:hypothetical protein
MMHAAKDSIDIGIICGDIHASLGLQALSAENFR